MFFKYTLPIEEIFLSKGGAARKISSLHDRDWAPIKSALVVASMFLDSSVKLTPPMVATSLMSSSPSLKNGKMSHAHVNNKQCILRSLVRNRMQSKVSKVHVQMAA